MRLSLLKLEYDGRQRTYACIIQPPRGGFYARYGFQTGNEFRRDSVEPRFNSRHVPRAHRLSAAAEDLQRGLGWRSLKYFGAGAVVASVTIASGESLFAARCGALFGYAFLWCFAAALVMKGVQVYSAGRYMVLTGEHPMTHWAYLPGPKNWVPITIALLSLFCFPFWQAGLPLMLGNILNWVFGIPETNPQFWLYARSWATLSILVSVALVLFESYAFLEKAQTVIVGLLLGSMLAAVFAARPDWMAVLFGMFTPAIPRYEDWMLMADPAIANRPPWVEIVTCVGAVGGGTYDYLGYIGLFREKGWGAIGLNHGKYQIDTQRPSMPISIDTGDENIRRGRRWLLPSQVDIIDLLPQRVHLQHVLRDPGSENPASASGSFPPEATSSTTKPTSSRGCIQRCCTSISSAFSARSSARSTARTKSIFALPSSA